MLLFNLRQIHSIKSAAHFKLHLFTYIRTANLLLSHIPTACYNLISGIVQINTVLVMQNIIHV